VDILDLWWLLYWSCQRLHRREIKFSAVRLVTLTWGVERRPDGRVDGQNFLCWRSQPWRMTTKQEEASPLSLFHTDRIYNILWKFLTVIYNPVLKFFLQICSLSSLYKVAHETSCWIDQALLSFNCDIMPLACRLYFNFTWRLYVQLMQLMYVGVVYIYLAYRMSDGQIIRCDRYTNVLICV
jgi:hypothetical protein